MRTVSIRLCDMERTCIPIGFVGENLYTRVRIDSKVVFDEYPTAIASLTVQDPNGSMYPGFISRDGDVIIWDVTASDLVYGGNGALQLAFFVDDVIAKSYICRTYVSKAMIGPGTIPTPIASWIDAANVVLGEAEEVFEALDNMTVAAETLAAGSTATAAISDVDGHKHIDFGIPRGDQGEQGEKGDTGAAGRDGTDGADGFSPTLVVSTITGGHRITITDKNGSQTVDVLDGEKGDTGATGNGIASVVLNQDYTLTITYTNGNSYTTTSIRGEKGETGATGQTGATGATPIISIGTVTTGAPGSEASATMDTTDPAHPVLSMSIPEGEPGDATIDDTSTAADRVWSAQKVNDELKSAIRTIGGDFNDFTEAAKPYALYLGTYTNAPPVTIIGTLYVHKDNGGIVWQVFVSDGDSTGVCTRHRGTNGTWTAWRTSMMTLIKEAVDLNNLKSDARYYIVTTYPDITNLPVATDITGSLRVVASQGYGAVVQEYTQASTGRTYTRIYSAGSWHDWNVYEVNLEKLFSSPNLAQGTDINALLTPGVYNCIYGSMTTASAPDGTNQTGVLIVTKDTRNNFYYQIFVQTSTSRVFSRLKRPAGWDAWTGGIGLANRSLAANTDLDELTSAAIYQCVAGCFSTNSAPPSQTQIGTLMITVDTTNNITYQTFIESDTGRIYTRRYRSSTGWHDWSYFDPKPTKEISILFIGNSLTQDGIAYLPYLLKNYYPEVVFKFYIWYNGGKTLGEQYGYFTNDTPCQIFSKAEGTQNWSNYSDSVKMSDILTTYHFDIVCMQEYFNYLFGSTKPYTDQQMLTDFQNCRDYIVSNYTGGNGLEFITLFHAPLRNNAPSIPSGESTDNVFQRTLAKNELFLQQTIADDMIANGIAVYRALSTDLDNLGDMGHLSPDGTHTQEGLPCLLQTYVAACWLFDKLGIAKSVYGCPLRITSSVYQAINVPGPNSGTGVITGTDAQNLLAQEVAIKAYKEGKYYVANNIFVPPT